MHLLFEAISLARNNCSSYKQITFPGESFTSSSSLSFGARINFITFYSFLPHSVLLFIADMQIFTTYYIEIFRKKEVDPLFSLNFHCSKGLVYQCSQRVVHHCFQEPFGKLPFLHTKLNFSLKIVSQGTLTNGVTSKP